ncbi:MAG: hypothetical protein HBSAPP03_14440 [Phycisphaerae bacterium]|nr:MAG: hypothetical protein HBSAPP03_14440 [Phycisphaerae bacterium]
MFSAPDPITTSTVPTDVLPEKEIVPMLASPPVEYILIRLVVEMRGIVNDAPDE